MPLSTYDCVQVLELAEASELFKILDKKYASNSDSQGKKLRYLIEWCKKNNREELVLRLSSENKGGWGNNELMDFTSHRLIVKKKPFRTKFIDMGYVAGLAPLPYLVIDKKLRTSLEKKGKNIDKKIQVSFLPEQSDTSMWYSEISQLYLRKGRETAILNMMGRMIVSNYLTVTSVEGKQYHFTLPVNKNGYFERLKYWLSELPLTIYASE